MVPLKCRLLPPYARHVAGTKQAKQNAMTRVFFMGSPPDQAESMIDFPSLPI